MTNDKRPGSEIVQGLIDGMMSREGAALESIREQIRRLNAKDDEPEGE